MTTIIAEIGINHNGNMDHVRQLMDMAKSCGADMVKFQKRTIDIVYSKEEQEAPRESPWGTTNGDQKRGLELSFDDYKEIDLYSRMIVMPWFASAWDLESLEFLDYFDLPCHKVASAMITNIEFLHEVARRKKPTYISTGLCAGMEPIKRAVGIFMASETPVTLMHCVGEYPCGPYDTNLRMIDTLKKEFPFIEVGFSSHAVSPIVPAFSALFDVSAIEVHITLDRAMYGSDQAASLEAPGLRKLVEYVELARTIVGDGKKRMTETEKKVAKKLRYWV